MTCIAAIADGIHVWMGGDSAVSCGDDVTQCREPKVRRWGSVLVGVAGSGKACQVALSARWPRYDGTDPFDWIVAVLLPAMRDEGREAHGHGSLKDLMLLIGVDGKLFRFRDETVWSDCSHDYAAIGVGEDVALGSLAETRALAPRVRIRRALKAASEHVSGVLPPWRMVSL